MRLAPAQRAACTRRVRVWWPRPGGGRHAAGIARPAPAPPWAILLRLTSSTINGAAVPVLPGALLLCVAAVAPGWMSAACTAAAFGWRLATAWERATTTCTGAATAAGTSSTGCVSVSTSSVCGRLCSCSSATATKQRGAGAGRGAGGTHRRRCCAAACARRARIAIPQDFLRRAGCHRVDFSTWSKVASSTQGANLWALQRPLQASRALVQKVPTAPSQPSSVVRGAPKSKRSRHRLRVTCCTTCPPTTTEQQQPTLPCHACSFPVTRKSRGAPVGSCLSRPRKEKARRSRASKENAHPAQEYARVQHTCSRSSCHHSVHESSDRYRRPASATPPPTPATHTHQGPTRPTTNA